MPGGPARPGRGSGAWAAAGPAWGVPPRGQARARGSLAEAPIALSAAAAVVTDARLVICDVEMIKMLAWSLQK